jgi:DamX protein
MAANRPAASAIAENAQPVERSAKTREPVSAQNPPAPPSSTPGTDAKTAPEASPSTAPEPPSATRGTEAAETTPKPAPLPARATGEQAGNGNREFLALSSSSYIVELAHSASKPEVDALRASVHPAHGALYELHLQRDGADWWLLVWGTFDSVDAARAARSELPADVPINAGWPRRVAPLQAEAQRSQP